MNQTTSSNNSDNKFDAWEYFIANTTGSIDNPAPNPRDIKKQPFLKFDDE